MSLSSITCSKTASHLHAVIKKFEDKVTTFCREWEENPNDLIQIVNEALLYRSELVHLREKINEFRTKENAEIESALDAIESNYDDLANRIEKVLQSIHYNENKKGLALEHAAHRMLTTHKVHAALTYYLLIMSADYIGKENIIEEPRRAAKILSENADEKFSKYVWTSAKKYLANLSGRVLIPLELDDWFVLCDEWRFVREKIKEIVRKHIVESVLKSSMHPNILKSNKVAFD